MIVRILYSVLIVSVIFSGLNCTAKLSEQKPNAHIQNTISETKPPQQFGYPISENDDCLIWWCEGTYKVRPKQILPSSKKKTIKISAARNEYEPFQLIIYPKQNITIDKISITDFSNTQNILPADKNIEIFMEDYVPIIRAFNRASERKDDRLGLWPDPLIPSYLKIPLLLEHSENRSFWFNVYIPSKTPAGDYEAKIGIKTAESSNPIEIAVKLHIFDFTLPQETHTRTAYEVNINNDWHNLKEPSDFRLAYNLYLQTLYKHRICPYDPMAYYPIKITKITPIKNEDKIVDYEILFDFSEFDKGAEYYLDKLGFDSFNFPIDTNYNGNQAFTDEYKLIARKIFSAEIKHLEEKGWLKKAYCYWIDEPDIPAHNIPIDYVKDGFKFLKENAPGLKRLLTFSRTPTPDSKYFDFVNLWVPVMHQIDIERAKERQALGEEVWWYVCCAPREPYPNNFIDHPAINHRIRYWMMEKYNIQGDLYWSTTFWNYRNPYEDATTYTDKTKQESYGNGDGVLLYPPVKTPPKEPLISAPVSSIRLELIREGLEDREYFWLLKQEINRVRSRLSQRKLKDAEALLNEPDNLIRNLRDFEKDPQKIYQSRLKLALMIEELNKIK
ncbi:MAG: DUF4091 domain-containing protein [Planctomycetota bacterium]